MKIQNILKIVSQSCISKTISKFKQTCGTSIKPGLDDLGKPLRLIITAFIELQEKIQGKVLSKLLKKLIFLLKTTSQERPWIDD